MFMIYHHIKCHIPMVSLKWEAKYRFCHIIIFYKKFLTKRAYFLKIYYDKISAFYVR